MADEFRQLVDRYRDSVYTFAYYSLGNREEAEDATQEVLVRLWKNWRRIDRKRISAWIRRVTRNACIDTLRSRQTHSARVVAGGESIAFLQAASNEPEPDTCTEVVQLRDHIQSALASLREPYRSIVILREIQDMKYEHISDSLDLPLNTVKSYLYRGRRMLRDKLKEALHERA